MVSASLLVIIGGCEKERTVVLTEPTTTPTPTITETLTFDLERNWVHLGDEYRGDFHSPSPWPGGSSKSYDFRLEGKVRSATLEMELYDVDNIGATVTLNSAIIASFAGSGANGFKSVSISTSPFVQYTNTLKVQSNTSDSQMEDFEYRNLKLVVTVEK
jgi:hypothetical protein